MSNRRLVGFAYLALAVPVLLVLRSLFQWIWLLADWQLTRLGPFQISDPIAALVAGGLAIGLYSNARTYSFSEEVVVELRKVVWPRRQEVQDSTVVVIVTALVGCAILGGFDLLWANLSGMILYR